jgi:hypothetical protein
VTPEIRRCRCGKDTATVGRDWGDGGFLGLSSNGPSTGRRDFVCQTCSYKFTIQPTRGRLVGGGCLSAMFVGMGCMGLLGGLIAGMAEGDFGGLIFGLVLLVVGVPLAWWTTGPWRTARRHPVVPDAPMPPIRFTLNEPFRRCTCGETARCTRVLQTRKAGLNLGREMTYACAHCKREFTIESAFSAIGATLGGLAASAFGVALLNSSPGEGFGAWACSGAVALLGVLTLLLSAWRFYERLRHPETGGASPTGEQSARR